MSRAVCSPNFLISSFNEVSKEQCDDEDGQPKQLRYNSFLNKIEKTKELLLGITSETNIFGDPVLVVPNEAVKKSLQL